MRVHTLWMGFSALVSVWRIVSDFPEPLQSLQSAYKVECELFPFLNRHAFASRDAKLTGRH